MGAWLQLVPGRVALIEADARDALASIPDASVDAVVTDPPYEINFMGSATRTWDRTGIAYDVDLWRGVLRVLRPGGHLLSAGGSRTYHRMACAIEDAGFEIRDSLVWLYGQGWARHKDQLKAAHEPIAVARKPFKGSMRANVARNGNGALFIDACRIESDGSHMVNGTVTKRTTHAGDARTGAALGAYGEGASFTPTNHPGGRYPANVVIDDLIDLGDATPYFYCAKASSRERPQVDGHAHNTVKPLNLMRWLVRLVTPPGGVVLDPFAGSGTTGEAALLEGMRCYLVEREHDHIKLIEARIARSVPHEEEEEVAV